jgi:hypothetical protein
VLTAAACCLLSVCPELPVLSRSIACVQNLHVSAHTEAHSITMLYQVQPGESGRSFGVHAAEVADFPSSVVKMAREKALELERLSGDVSSILFDPATQSESKSNAENGHVESTPPGSQEPVTPSPDGSPAHVRGSGASKRVQPNREETLHPLPPGTAMLLSRPLSDFEDAVGQVDRLKLEAWVKTARTVAGAAQPMEI